VRKEQKTGNKTGEQRPLFASGSQRNGRTGTTLRLVTSSETGRTGSTLRLVVTLIFGRMGGTLRLVMDQKRENGRHSSPRYGPEAQGEQAALYAEGYTLPWERGSTMRRGCTQGGKEAYIPRVVRRRTYPGWCKGYIPRVV